MGRWKSLGKQPIRKRGIKRFLETAKSTHHPNKIDDQHRECKTGGGAYFAFFLRFRQFAHHPPNIPPDEKGLLWGRCVVCGPLLRKTSITPCYKVQKRLTQQNIFWAGRVANPPAPAEAFPALQACNAEESEKRLLRLKFWDILWEQFCLSDHSALIDASLRRRPL